MTDQSYNTMNTQGLVRSYVWGRIRYHPWYLIRRLLVDQVDGQLRDRIRDGISRQVNSLVCVNIRSNHCIQIQRHVSGGINNAV